MLPFHPIEQRKSAAMRVALSHYLPSGMSAALGLLVISAGVHWMIGPFAAAAASVGVVVCIPPDQPAPQRGKFWQLLPALLVGLPLFFGVQVLHAAPLQLGLLLVPASFLAFLAGAWGKRGLPVAISVMFSMVFSMAVPDHTSSATNLATSLYFALGGSLYLVWATLANAALNARYRVQMLADTLLALAQLMRTQAQQLVPPAADSVTGGQVPLIGTLLQQQAALADQLQMARDILLESPRTARRQQLAGMLLHVIDMRDHLLACELDLEAVQAQAGHTAVLLKLQDVLHALSNAIEQLADALLRGQTPKRFENLRPQLQALRPAGAGDSVRQDDGPSPAMLAMGLANRIGYLNDETVALVAIAAGEVAPDVDLVRANWQLFVSPTTWSWLPLSALWHWDAPPLRHAMRAALAIATAYAVGLALPWGSHDYWILLTIVVVLRGSLAQTLERRNSRAAGTLIGCLLAGLLLYCDAPHAVLLVMVTLAQALSHAFATRRYLVTAIAATVLGLLQVHLLNAGASPGFDVIERMADTLIGVSIAWAFSYILPSWERGQIAGLVKRTLAAQERHAREALGLWQLRAADNAPELQWRLARREAFDSLSALVQAAQRSLSEPRAVRPPLEPLGRLLAYSYQLQGQLTTVKTMLVQRSGRLRSEHIDDPLKQAAQAIAAALGGTRVLRETDTSDGCADLGELPNPFEGDLSPWLVRRLALAREIAVHIRSNADQVLAETALR